VTNDVWKRDEVQSPCVKVCVLHPESGYCIGCLRTVEEISLWTKMAPETRTAIMAALPARRPEVAPRRRGGRAARLAGY
jgi:uncharacterized protein